MFNTNMFHNKKILDMVKMLHDVKETMSLMESNADAMIDSGVNELSSEEKMIKMNHFAKN